MISKFWNRLKRIFSLGLSIAKAGFKLKNEGTWLGVFWYLLGPILTFFLLLGIFTDRLGSNIPNYPLYLLLGIILFNYFKKIGDESIKIIRNHQNMVRSINFPKESLVISIILKTLFSHIFEIIILIVFLIFFGISIKGMIFYPLILIFLSIFCLGLALILSSLEVYFFDLEDIWGFASKLLWLGTPIFYAIEGQTKLEILNLFNPMFYFITIARDLIIYTRLPQTWLILGMVGYSILFLISGIYIFNKLKNRFSELL